MTRILVPYHLDEHRPGLDVPYEPGVTVTRELAGDDVWSRLAPLYADVADVVADAVRRGDMPLVMSGDCMVSQAVVSGVQRAHDGAPPSVVWFDAHGDVQTLETTTSGYLGGMPLRMIAGYRPELLADRLGQHPVPEDRIVLVDGRDLDPPERDYLAASDIRQLFAAELDGAHVPAGPVYLHIDLDVVDGAELPGLLFPAPGGPSVSEVGQAVRRVLDTGRVAAVGLGCTWHDGQGAARRVRDALPF